MQANRLRNRTVTDSSKNDDISAYGVHVVPELHGKFLSLLGNYRDASERSIVKLDFCLVSMRLGTPGAREAGCYPFKHQGFETYEFDARVR